MASDLRERICFIDFRTMTIGKPLIYYGINMYIVYSIYICTRATDDDDSIPSRCTSTAVYGVVCIYIETGLPSNIVK